MDNELINLIYHEIDGYVTATEENDEADKKFRDFGAQPEPGIPNVIKTETGFAQYLENRRIYDETHNALLEKRNSTEATMLYHLRVLRKILPFGMWIERGNFAVGLGLDAAGDAEVFIVLRNSESNYRPLDHPEVPK